MDSCVHHFWPYIRIKICYVLAHLLLFLCTKLCRRAWMAPWTQRSTVNCLGLYLNVKYTGICHPLYTDTFFGLNILPQNKTRFTSPFNQKSIYPQERSKNISYVTVISIHKHHLPRVSPIFLCWCTNVYQKEQNIWTKSYLRQTS